jgi:hypothetical protein
MNNPLQFTIEKKEALILVIGQLEALATVCFINGDDRLQFYLSTILDEIIEKMKNWSMNCLP